jgi:hypothetical protein
LDSEDFIYFACTITVLPGQNKIKSTVSLDIASLCQKKFDS